MNNEQPKVVGAGTSVNKEHWRAKRLLIPPVYFLRGIGAYDELQIVVTEVGQVRQTVTPHRKKLLTTALLLWVSYWRFSNSWPILFTTALLCCGISCENGPSPRLMTGEVCLIGGHKICHVDTGEWIEIKPPENASVI